MNVHSCFDRKFKLKDCSFEKKFNWTEVYKNIDSLLWKVLHGPRIQYFVHKYIEGVQRSLKNVLRQGQKDVCPKIMLFLFLYICIYISLPPTLNRWPSWQVLRKHNYTFQSKLQPHSQTSHNSVCNIFRADPHHESITWTSSHKAACHIILCMLQSDM